MRSINSSPSRRRFLELLGAGAVGTAAGMPLMFPPSARGAQPGSLNDDGFPKRLVIVAQFNGTLCAEWLPKDSANGLVMGPILEPLQPFAKQVLLAQGFKNQAGVHTKYAGCGTHCSNGNILTGVANIGESTPGGISVDQFVAKAIYNNNRFRSFEATVPPTANPSTVSATGAKMSRSTERSPYTVYERLFGEMALPKERQDALRALRTSAIDVNSKRTMDLTANLAGREGRFKLEAHHDSLSEVRKSLYAPTSPGCTVPELDGSTKLSLSESKNIPAIAKAHIDMLVGALACDLTRVYTLSMFDIGDNCYPYQFIADVPPDAKGRVNPDGHAFAHESRGTLAAQKVRFERWKAEQLAYMLKRMSEIKEGDKTMLDHSLVVQVQCMAEGTHAAYPLPMVFAGGAGKWKMNRYLQVGPTTVSSGGVYNVNHNDALISICHAMGQEVKTFGEPSYCKGPIPGLNG